MTIEIKTERLVLRPIQLSDAPFVQREFGKWEIVQYLPNTIPFPYPEDGAVTYIQKMLGEMAREESYMFLIQLADKTPIGVITYVTKDGDNQQLSRGFWLSTAYQGHGYMTEAANGANAWIFENTATKSIIASNDVNNKKSFRVKEKQGFKYLGREKEDPPRHRGEGDSYLDQWILTKDTWFALKAK